MILKKIKNKIGLLKGKKKKQNTIIMVHLYCFVSNNNKKYIL
jgi:hypothetical protein